MRGTNCSLTRLVTSATESVLYLRMLVYMVCFGVLMMRGKLKGDLGRQQGFSGDWGQDCFVTLAQIQRLQTGLLNMGVSSLTSVKKGKAFPLREARLRTEHSRSLERCIAQLRLQRYR